MADLKCQQWSWMLAHVGVYASVTGAVVIAFAVAHHTPAWLALAAVLFIGVTHSLLDRRTFTLGWMRWNGTSPGHPWLPIVVDQAFHLVSLAVVAQVLATFGQ